MKANGAEGQDTPIVACPKCGTKNPRDTDRCIYCGDSLTGDVHRARTGTSHLPCGVCVALAVVAGLVSLWWYPGFLVITILVSVWLAARAVWIAIDSRRRARARAARGAGVQVRHAPAIRVLDVVCLILGLLAAADAVLIAVLAARGLSLPSAKVDACIEPWIGHLWYGAVAVSLAGLMLGNRARASRMAMAGVVLAVGSGWLGILCAMALPVELRERTSAWKAVCFSNVKCLTQAMQMYLAENDNMFPEATAWSHQLMPHVKRGDVFTCPEAPGVTCAYAMNSALSGLRYDAMTDPEHTILMFESDKGWNAAGGAELLTEHPRHRHGGNVSFADGRAKWLVRNTVHPETRNGTVYTGPGAKWLKEYAHGEIRWEPE